MVNVAWSGSDLVSLARMLADGRLRSVVHRTVGLDEVPAAVAEVEAGHVPGRIVVVP